MKTKHVPLFVTAAVFSIFILAGLAPVSRAKTIKIHTVTLVSRSIVNGVDNYSQAAFSFRYGVNGKEGLRYTKNNWDVLFGNGVIRDAFSVTMVTDDCSRIQDLGELDWTDTFKVPKLPAYPKPTEEMDVQAVVGHMYLVHNKDSDTDHYSLFRVEALDSGRSVTISWRLIKNLKGIEIGHQDWYDPTFYGSPPTIRP